MNAPAPVKEGTFREWLESSFALAWDMLTAWRHVPESIDMIWFRLLTAGFWAAFGALLALLTILIDPLLFWTAPILLIIRARNQRRRLEASAKDFRQ